MIRFFAIHPTAANLLMLVLILLGLSSLSDLKRETFPDFSTNAISATVVYPGATPASVESALCIPMEDAVDGLSNIDEVSCEATEGLASLTVEMEEGGDFSKLMSEVKNEIDGINEELSPLTSFILPGGSSCAAHLHVARTVTRRAERMTVKLANNNGENSKINKLATIYLNRLSDHLFVLSRKVNDNGRIDVLWVPGKNR